MAFRKRREFPIVLAGSVAAYALLAVGFMYAKEISHVSLPAPFGDEPPRITMTSVPEGEADLATYKLHLRLTDDRALDFKTYRMTVVEIGRTLDMPIDGLIGRDYETDLSFSWLAGDARLAGAGRMTVTVSIADDQGKATSVSKVVPLKNWQAYLPPNVRARLERP
jgi:hypothetical protein